MIHSPSYVPAVRVRSAFALLVVCGFTTAACAAPKLIPGINPTPRSAPGATAKSIERTQSPKRHALLIGVGQAEFRGIPQHPLPQCMIDAKTLAATLEPRGYACEVITEGQPIEPTASAIRAQVMIAAAAAQEGEHLLIYISTHGDVIDGKSVILAKDDAVEIDFIKRQLAGSKASVKVLMLDCCRNNKGFEKTATEVRDVHCIMACRPDQLSQVGQSGMSVFTEALVDGIVECHADRVKDGVIELDELMYFLEREVPLRAQKLGTDKQQNPTRTVVDPKVVTPVFAECTLFDQLTFGPEVYAKSPPPRSRLLLELETLRILKIRPGMTLDEATAAVGGTWTLEPTFDDDTGAALGVVENAPEENQVMVVRFADKKVALAQVLYRDLSKESYSSTRIRGAIYKLIGKEPLAKLDESLKGLKLDGIMGKLGSADNALLPTSQFPDAVGELRYPEVPRPGQMLVVRTKGGVYESLDIAMTE